MGWLGLLVALGACGVATDAGQVAADHESERLQGAYERCQAEHQHAFSAPIEWPQLADVDAAHGPGGRWSFEGAFSFEDGGTSRFWCDMSYSDIAGWRVESIGSKNQP